MKSIFKKKYSIIGVVCIIFFGVSLYVFIDNWGGIANFRTTQDAVSAKERLNLIGLRDINASGGGVASFSDVQKKLAYIKGDKVIIDVLTDPHGYVYGVPSTFLGYNLPKPAIRHYMRRLIATGTIEKRPVVSEAKEAKKHGFDYKKVDIGSRYISDDKSVDEFVELLDTLLKKDVWIHVHCIQGRGRTSMVLMMVDIMKNAPKVSVEEIAKRQFALGSEDLLNTDVWKKSSYKLEQLVNRKEFLENFYAFVCQRKVGGIQQWSVWRNLKQQGERALEVARVSF